jgi:uncharacterized membrane protein YeaQ/YmgE (transglycosylase-associated protein family)
MSATIINLIVQLIAGALGGNAAGATMKNLDLGTLGNTIAGAIGGAGGGTLFTALLPMLQCAANRRSSARSRTRWLAGAPRTRRDALPAAPNAAGKDATRCGFARN